MKPGNDSRCQGPSFVDPLRSEDVVPLVSGGSKRLRVPSVMGPSCSTAFLRGEFRSYGRAQFVNPEVADNSAVPPTPKVPDVLVFRLLTKFSTPGDAVATRPTMPNLFKLGSVACLRRLMPGDVVLVPVLVLPPVVLPLTRKHAVVLPTADPESSRIPGLAAIVVFGAATVFPVTV